jgi:hypothetical protein
MTRFLPSGHQRGMTSASLRPRIIVASTLFGLLGFACGDSGHPLGQANGGSGGTGGQTGAGGGSAGSVGTGGRGGSAGTTGGGGHAGNGGGGAVATGGSAGTGAGGMATGGTGGSAGHGGAGGLSTGGSGGQAGQGTGGAGGRSTGGSGGQAGQGTGGAGGRSTGGSGGQAGQGAGGAGGAGGAPVCSSAPLVSCPSNEVCDDDTPNRCGAGYEPGHCIVLPQSCPPTSDPICGCNGIAYNNDCERQMARAQLDHTGACTGGGGAGGGSGGQGGGAGGGTGACGGTDCASGKVCVHAQCLNCTPAPAPFCADVPAACSGTPTCSCLPFTICQQNGQAGGTCISVDSSGVHCG